MKTSIAEAIMRVASEGDGSHPMRPHIAAQESELQLRLVSYKAKENFQPGQAVRAKRGFGLFNDPGSVAAIFWRYLDLGRKQDELLAGHAYAKNFASGSIDCCIWIVSDDGSGVIFIPCDSAILESYKPEIENGENR